MNPAVTGALAGAALGLILVVAEYLMVRSAAAERARRTKGKVELSDTERKQMRSISGFCLWLPPSFAAFAWLIWS